MWHTVNFHRFGGRAVTATMSSKAKRLIDIMSSPFFFSPSVYGHGYMSPFASRPIAFPIQYCYFGFCPSGFYFAVRFWFDLCWTSRFNSAQYYIWLIDWNAHMPSVVNSNQATPFLYRTQTVFPCSRSTICKSNTRQKRSWKCIPRKVFGVRSKSPKIEIQKLRSNHIPADLRIQIERKSGESYSVWGWSGWLWIFTSFDTIRMLLPAYLNLYNVFIY